MVKLFCQGGDSLTDIQWYSTLQWVVTKVTIFVASLASFLGCPVTCNHFVVKTIILLCQRHINHSVYVTFRPLSKNCHLENELTSIDYTLKVGEKQLFGCAEGVQVQRVQDRSSLQLVYGTDSLTILHSSKFTCTKCVPELNRTADVSKTRSEIVKQLALLPATCIHVVPTLHGSLLNHMTIITNVGAFYVDHMNNDMPEVNSLGTRLPTLCHSDSLKPLQAWRQG